MATNLFHLFLVLVLGGITTYDTLMSNKRKRKETGNDNGKILDLQN